MRVRLGNYVIKTADYGYNICEVVVVQKEGSKNQGKERERFIGFYPTLKIAGAKIAHLTLGESDGEDISYLIECYENKMDALIKQLEEHG